MQDPSHSTTPASDETEENSRNPVTLNVITSYWAAKARALKSRSIALSRFARSRVRYEQKELFEDERTQSIVGTKKKEFLKIL